MNIVIHIQYLIICLYTNYKKKRLLPDSWLEYRWRFVRLVREDHELGSVPIIEYNNNSLKEGMFQIIELSIVYMFTTLYHKTWQSNDAGWIWPIETNYLYIKTRREWSKKQYIAMNSNSRELMWFIMVDYLILSKET